MDARRRAILAAGLGLYSTGIFPQAKVNLPKIGLGTWQTFDVGGNASERAPLKEVLDAFFAVYATRMADLLRIAGTGTQPAPGELSLDLANRLTAEASKTAGHFLNMCIRALDYCPPVDITFGDFLRALITADSELVPDDDRGYRDILIEAFRRRGIRPGDVTSYADTSLRWQPLETPSGKRLFCRGLQFSMLGLDGPEVAGANAHLLAEFAERHAAALGLRRRGNGQKGIQPWTFHPVHRVGPDGQLRFEIVAELVQQERVTLARGRAQPRCSGSKSRRSRRRPRCLRPRCLRPSRLRPSWLRPSWWSRSR